MVFRKSTNNSKTMKESVFQVVFGHWLKNIFKKTGAFELKMTKSKNLPFNTLKEHQKQALLIAKHGCIYFKIPDSGYQQNPFDCFSLACVPSYVVVQFYVKGCKDFYLIDIDDWIKAEKECKLNLHKNRMSLTEEMAQKIGKKESLEMIKTSFLPTFDNQ